MRSETHPLLFVLGLAACGADTRGADTRDGEAAVAQSHAPISSAAASASASAPDANRPIGAPLCLPVMACNMFVSCALAQPERAPSGETSYRVLQYDHHPHQVGSSWQRDEVCWGDQPGGAQKGCADAFLYRNVPCTATPNAPMALGYTCELVDRKCVAAVLPAPSAPAGPASLGTSEIEKVVRQLQATARTTCWDPLPKASGPSSVKVTVRFTIEASGATSKVGASGPSEPPSLARCVGKLVEAARFPASESATAIAVPFSFAR